MIVIVCGGRNYEDRDLVYIVLDRIHKETPITRIVHGGATGADYLGACWADSRGVPSGSYRARWDLHGRAAGPLRNQRMLDEAKPELVVAFPGGRGTADMVDRARRARVVVEHAARDAGAAGEALVDDLKRNAASLNMSDTKGGSDG